MKYQTFDGSWRETDVPCGKCEECLRRSRQDLQVLVYRQLKASKLPSWFVTLSYHDDYLPLYVTFTKYEDKRSPEWKKDWLLSSFDPRADYARFVCRSKPVRLGRTPIKLHNNRWDSLAADPSDWRPTRSSLMAREDAVRRFYASEFSWYGYDGKYARKCIKPGCILEVSRFHMGDHVVIATVTTSVCRKDVSLWIKSARVAFRRKFKRDLDFKFVCVQEYGPKGHRPHYHLIVSNIQHADLVWILQRWIDTYICDGSRPHIKSGSGVVYDEISLVTSKGNNGYTAAARYLSEYFKKSPEFEEPSVKAGFAAVPRKVSSIHYGIGDIDVLRSYLLGYDVFGKYDVSDPSTYPDMERLLDVVQSRMKIVLPYSRTSTCNLAVPKYLKKFIYNATREKDSIRRVSSWPSPDADPEVFNQYCESAGFWVPSPTFKQVRVKYPCSSELSQGLADLAQFRSDLLYKESLASFAGLDPNCSPEHFAEIPLSKVLLFHSLLETSVASTESRIRDHSRKQFSKTTF